MSKILVVEDEKEINKLVSDFLQENGHEVISLYDGLKACETVEKEGIELVLLDLMLPYRNGDMVLSRHRSLCKGDHAE